MAKEIRRIEVEPAENGGHTVTHHFKEEKVKDRHAHSGISMGYTEPEHHVFGKDEGHAMLAHIANHLQIPEPGGEKEREKEVTDDDHEEEDGSNEEGEGN